LFKKIVFYNWNYNRKAIEVWNSNCNYNFLSSMCEERKCACAFCNEIIWVWIIPYPYKRMNERQHSYSYQICFFMQRRKPDQGTISFSLVQIMNICWVFLTWEIYICTSILYYPNTEFRKKETKKEPSTIIVILQRLSYDWELCMCDQWNHSIFILICPSYIHRNVWFTLLSKKMNEGALYKFPNPVQLFENIIRNLNLEF
jgi:hypothetical protein